jgi:uncharacterized protein (TIGR02266 family)
MGPVRSMSEVVRISTRWRRGSAASLRGAARTEKTVMAKVSLRLEDPDSDLEIGIGDDLGADEEEAERRRANRASVTVRIDYSTVDEMFSEFTRDINEGGVFIETEKPHEAGTEVSMQFHLPGTGEVLQTIGRVVRVSSGNRSAPAGMGIEFDELTNADRGKIDVIVRALRSKSSA